MTRRLLNLIPSCDAWSGLSCPNAWVSSSSCGSDSSVKCKCKSSGIRPASWTGYLKEHADKYWLIGTSNYNASYTADKQGDAHYDCFQVLFGLQVHTTVTREEIDQMLQSDILQSWSCHVITALWAETCLEATTLHDLYNRFVLQTQPKYYPKVSCGKYASWDIEINLFCLIENCFSHSLWIL